MANHDHRLIKLIGWVVVVLILLNLPAAIHTLGEKTGIDTQGVERLLRHSFVGGIVQAQERFWHQVKGISTAVGEQGLSTAYEGLYTAKMQSHGLMLDEEGRVVRRADIDKLRSPYKFLVIGSSSMLEGMGPQIQADLSKIPTMAVVREGHYSTGLNRVDYYNWYNRARELISAHKPQAVVIQIGGNDGQDIADLATGKKYRMDDPKWDEIYRKRVDDLMRILSSGSVKKIYWIELEIPRTSDFDRKFRQVNKIQREVAASYPKVVYVETWSKFATPDGKFANVLPDPTGKMGIVKYSDGVHLTPHGSRIMSNIVLGYVQPDLILPEQQ